MHNAGIACSGTTVLQQKGFSFQFWGVAKGGVGSTSGRLQGVMARRCHGTPGFLLQQLSSSGTPAATVSVRNLPQLRTDLTIEMSVSFDHPFSQSEPFSYFRERE